MQLASLEQSITKVQTDRPDCERGHAPPRGAPPVPVVSAPLQLQPSMPGAALRVLYAFAEDTRLPRIYGAFVQEQRRLARTQEDDFRVWRSKLPVPGKA